MLRRTDRGRSTVTMGVFDFASTDDAPAAWLNTHGRAGGDGVASETPPSASASTSPAPSRSAASSSSVCCTMPSTFSSGSPDVLTTDAQPSRVRTRSSPLGSLQVCSTRVRWPARSRPQKKLSVSGASRHLQKANT